MFVVVLALVACAPSNSRVRSTTPIGGPSLRAEIVAADAVAELAEDEGLLVVHVDTNAGLERLVAGDVAIAEKLAKGRFVWLVRLKAGRYAWTEIAFAAEPIDMQARRRCRVDRVARINPLFDLRGVERSEFQFEIEAGAINYAGELLLKAEYHRICRGAYRIWIRNRNHSAMALRSLLQTHLVHLDALPIRYAGRSGDGFLEFYSRERERLAVDSPVEGP
ncbi:MAG: hypothetical protein R3F21_20345 [Myxococcota bacterium]